MSQAGIVSSTSGPVPPAVPTSFVTDSGTAIPALNILDLNGGQGIRVTGSSNNVVISLLDVTYSGTATTSDGGGQTANLNTTIPVPTSSTVSISVNMSGYSTGVVGLGGNMTATAINNAGVVTIIASPIIHLNLSATLIGATFTAVVSGTNVLIQCTGKAGNTINWKGIIETSTAP